MYVDTFFHPMYICIRLATFSIYIVIIFLKTQVVNFSYESEGARFEYLPTYLQLCRYIQCEPVIEYLKVKKTVHMCVIFRNCAFLIIIQLFM
jgi:hypothetical protein